MVALQIISKILLTKDCSILEKNNLTKDYFVGYQDEIQFILDHIKQYGAVPDKATFLSHFNKINLVDVEESDRYLVDTIREEYLYYKSIPVIQKAAELLKTDSNAAAEYLVSAMNDLKPTYSGGIDIVADADLRYEQFLERRKNQDGWFFTTGFEELDSLIHGIQRGEELIVIFARINNGKSWILEKICTHVWEIGFNVGYISPEMGPSSIGYRFDTLHNNFSNTGLMWGKDEISEDVYKSYIDDLKKRDNKFLVATPKDFGNEITVSKLKNWVKQYKLDLIAVDGITYMTDERYKRGDNKTTSLTNISEDLMSMSVELGIPVLIVVQANRGGVAVNEEDENAPELDKIKDSDGMGANASKVISLRQLKDNVLRLEIKKQRFGPVGGKLNYQWDINTGVFTNIPSIDDAQPRQTSEKKVKDVKKQYKDKEDVF